MVKQSFQVPGSSSHNRSNYIQKSLRGDSLEASLCSMSLSDSCQLQREEIRVRRYVQVGFRLKQHPPPRKGSKQHRAKRTRELSTSPGSATPRLPTVGLRRDTQHAHKAHTKLCSSTITREIFETDGATAHTHSDVLQPFRTALQLCIPDSSDLHVDQALITVLLHCNGRDVLVL